MYIYIYTHIYIYIYIYIYISNRKQKPIIRLPFALSANGSCHLSIYEETNGSVLFANGLKGLSGLVHLCIDINVYMGWGKHLIMSTQRIGIGDRMMSS
jgi:hypothetical protein